MKPENLKLIETCWACPEQYDVLDPDGDIVGYLRLRHGRFTAHLDDAAGPVVFEGCPNGDGRFDDEERDRYTNQALKAIAARL